ncbi:pyrroline-5-carboxylate reductase [Nocardia sp. NPDC003693]
MAKIAVIGGGRIGAALISGLLESGWARDDLMIVGREQGRADAAGQRLGVRATVDTAAAVRASDLIVLAVKPHDVNEVLAGVGAAEPGARVVVSLVAGVPIAQLEARLPAGVPVVRAMPNTPMMVRRAITAMAPGRRVTAGQLELASRMLRSVGEVVIIDECRMDAVTAVSGSGPAYFYVIAEAMVDAAVQLGLPRPLALESVTQTMRGTAVLLRDSGRTAADLRAATTAPAGATAAAVRELERCGLRTALHEAVRAAESCAAEQGARTS